MLDHLLPFVDKYPYKSELWMIHFRTWLYTILMVVLIALYGNFHSRTVQEERINGLKNPLFGNYVFAISGILLITFNVFLSSYSLVFSNGSYILFGAYKAVFYNLGTLLLIIGLVNISLKIIYFNNSILRAIKIIFMLSIAVAVIGQILVLANTLTDYHFSDVRILLAIGGGLYLILLVSTAISLSRQLKYKASPIESYRIKVMEFTLILQIIQLLARVATLLVSDIPYLFNVFSLIIYPVIDFISYPISVLFLSWSLYTPVWLQVKMDIIPKEYSQLI